MYALTLAMSSSGVIVQVLLRKLFKKHVYMMTLLEIHDFLPFFFTALSSSSHQHDLIYISQWINLKLYMYLIIYLSRDYFHLHYVVCSFTLFVILLLEFAFYP